jgi:hypothetical protein
VVRVAADLEAVVRPRCVPPGWSQGGLGRDRVAHLAGLGPGCHSSGPLGAVVADDQLGNLRGEWTILCGPVSNHDGTLQVVGSPVGEVPGMASARVVSRARGATAATGLGAGDRVIVVRCGGSQFGVVRWWVVAVFISGPEVPKPPNCTT